MQGGQCVCVYTGKASVCVCVWSQGEGPVSVCECVCVVSRGGRIRTPGMRGEGRGGDRERGVEYEKEDWEASQQSVRVRA